ncbi:MAG: hypothetical protein M3P89_07065 [Actinomycetota bacterium]|nr:hypothetical protein [Actinomycetota bacterium]
MGNGRRRALTRLLASLGAGWGLALFARPLATVDRLCPEYPRSRVWVVRLLGARLLAQHAAVLAAPGGRLVGAASGIDLLHAATMVPLLREPRYRRAALVSGGVAAVSAAVLPAVAPRSTA